MRSTSGRSTVSKVVAIHNQCKQYVGRDRCGLEGCFPCAEAPARRRRQPLRAGEVAEPRLQPTVKFKPVDAPSLPELRELNELNYTRFDAKLEQRAVEPEAKIDRLAIELEA